MGCGIDARARPLTIVKPAREVRGQALCLPQAVTRGVPSAHDGQRQLIARLTVAAAEQHSRRIRNLAQQAGIARICVRDDVDLMLAARADLPVDIDLPARRIRSHRRGPMPGTCRSCSADAASAAAHVPNRSSKSRRVRGPTPGIRHTRSVSRRESLSSVAAVVGEFTGVSSHKQKEFRSGKRPPQRPRRRNVRAHVVDLPVNRKSTGSTTPAVAQEPREDSSAHPTARPCEGVRRAIPLPSPSHHVHQCTFAAVARQRGGKGPP